MLILICGAAAAETRLFAVNVGKGDALILMGDDYTCLIDTGKKRAQEQIEDAFEHFGITRLDALFITHTDGDHIGGLKWLKDYDIGAVCASAYAVGYEDKKHPAEKLVKNKDIEVQWLREGASYILGENAVLYVYAPEAAASENEDDNSLVMLLDCPDGRILLCGDMEMAEEEQLLASGADLKCDVLKVPNHGDSDACGSELVAACGAKTAVISTNEAEKPDTPSPRVLAELTDAGCDIYVTQDSGLGILVTLDAGEVKTEYIG